MEVPTPEVRGNSPREPAETSQRMRRKPTEGSMTSGMSQRTRKVVKSRRELEEELRSAEQTYNDERRGSLNVGSLHKLTVFNPQLPMPIPLPKTVRINQDLLSEFIDQTSFTLYRVRNEFESEDKRYLKLKKGETIVGFCDICGWIFGFKENDAKAFGFSPGSYLDVIKEISE